MSSAYAKQRQPDLFTGFPGPIVEADWLAQHVMSPALRIVDLRDRQNYDAGHLPGAVWFDRTMLSRTCEDHSVTLISSALFASVIGRLGISNTTPVVAYDDVWGMHAARFVWALWRYGHTQAAVLSGGVDAWTHAKQRVTRSRVLCYPQTFVATPDATQRADMLWLVSHANDRQFLLLDVREEYEYVAGHLPGARHWEWQNAISTRSWAMLHHPESLRERLISAGITPNQRIVTYCNAENRAAHTLVMLRSLGYPDVRLLDDAWRSRVKVAALAAAMD
ncbi:Thiosulfate sulfurtransferase [Oscillochloris trichoides DG-6]|uniref:thiosulfate sulfurtransferase n=1 Tax=Oscillochloris trichoides DG-6 TaxID=765420 RepID=E1IFP4_9CHLR|nr:rhodanese-like domain-containing protein [Oscillochloris trichoides]EFO79990.1 Thiosulfate sulfurtransferase [Oscillochloris trichoides DG-6]